MRRPRQLRLAGNQLDYAVDRHIDEAWIAA